MEHFRKKRGMVLTVRDNINMEMCAYLNENGNKIAQKSEKNWGDGGDHGG